jgi:hypothetical protein
LFYKDIFQEEQSTYNDFSIPPLDGLWTGPDEATNGETGESHAQGSTGDTGVQIVSEFDEQQFEISAAGETNQDTYGLTEQQSSEDLRRSSRVIKFAAKFNDFITYCSTNYPIEKLVRYDKI